MKFTVLYRKTPDARAPEFPRLSEYEDAGEIDSPSCKSVVSVLSRTADVPGIEKPRPLKVGDIIRTQLDQNFILTPTGQLALVTLIDE